MVATQRQADTTPQVTAPAVVPHARPASEPHTLAPASARELTRLLSVAAEHGHLYAQPSPVIHESVITVYQLPPGQTGERGDRVDTFYVRAALRAQLLRLGPSELHTLPNHDVCPLQPLTLTAAGRAWLTTHAVPGVPARLNPLDRRPHTALYPSWSTASWTGSRSR